MRIGMVAVDALGVRAFLGHAVIEGEADRIDDRRLARAGGSFEEEQTGRPEPTKVDLLGAGERPDRLHPQIVQLHQPVPPTCLASKPSAVETWPAAS